MSFAQPCCRPQKVLHAPIFLQDFGIIRNRSGSQSRNSRVTHHLDELGVEMVSLVVDGE